MEWQTVIGLEVHAELAVRSKIFCGCPASFGGEPNTKVCPVCAGLPGSLPVLNKLVVEYAVKAGLALNCEITRHCKFDRKNYFYPDLPKAYQISQLYEPICREGSLDIKNKTIRIREIHIEEDAGKLLHDALCGGGTLMDFNRCGVPLIEIVTHPDFENGEEALFFLEKLREILLYLCVCDCKMQEGSLRADVNLSIRRQDGELGTRTEMKNLNSFKAIGRAIEYERRRQIEILEKGGVVIQETRRFDDEAGESYGMRQKEDAQDYRYFPEPDLLPIDISDEWLSRIKQSLPELAHEKRARYIARFNIPEPQAAVLTSHKRLSDLFEEIALKSGYPIEAANLITGEIMRLMNISGILPEDIRVSPEKLTIAIEYLMSNKINRGAYKEIVEMVFTKDADPHEYITLNNLLISSDNTAVTDAINAVLNNNESAVADYRNGKTKAFGFLMGAVMRTLGKSADPDAVKNTLTKALEQERP